MLIASENFAIRFSSSVRETTVTLSGAARSGDGLDPCTLWAPTNHLQRTHLLCLQYRLSIAFGISVKSVSQQAGSFAAATSLESIEEMTLDSSLSPSSCKSSSSFRLFAGGALPDPFVLAGM
jgi:hypothetical protein